MPTFSVQIPELYVQTVEVEASSMDEALVHVHNGDGVLIEMRYIRILDPHEHAWVCEQILEAKHPLSPLSPLSRRPDHGMGSVGGE